MSRPMFLLSLGAGSFGALLGAWIALSQSQVVMTALPLLFSFAGGACGAFLWRNDPSDCATRRKIEMFGSAGAAFSLCCLAAMMVAIRYRATILEWETIKPDLVAVADYADPLGALIYRDKLMLLGASNDDIKIMLAKPFPKGWETTSDLIDKFLVETEANPSSYGADDDKSKGRKFASPLPQPLPERPWLTTPSGPGHGGVIEKIPPLAQ